MYVCRLCQSNKLTMFLDLGFTPPADAFLVESRISEPELYYPLQVVRCDNCNFIQLNHIVDPKILYQIDYPYESSITQTGRNHFDEFARDMTQHFGLGENDLVIDIGSNVGTLLGFFKNRNTRVLGIDPAENIAKIANKNGIETIAEFFDKTLAQKIVSERGKAACVTGSNVFAHIDDLDGLMTGITSLLYDDGIFVIESPYLVHLFSNLEYDTIYHEHLSYISLSPLIPFFEKHGMEVFNIQQKDIHGGSIRIFICFKGRRAVSDDVAMICAYENDNKIYADDNLANFADRVYNHRDELVWLVKSLKRKGYKIAGVSAPAKGMTLLNFCKIGTETLDFLTEKSELKIGRYSPGSHIPVKTDTALLRENVDYALLLAWNFKDEIMRNLKEFRNCGGKFIIPIPHPVIVDTSNYQHKV